MASILDKSRKHKLTISFLLIIVLFLSFGIFTINGLFTLGNLTKTIYEHPLVVSNASLNAALNMTKMHRGMKDVVLASFPDEIDAAMTAVDGYEKIVYQQLDIIRENILGEDGQTLEKQTRLLFIRWKPIREEVGRLLRSGTRQDAVLITKGKGADHVAKLEARMLALTSYARNKAAGFLAFAERRQSNFEKITIALTLAGILLSVIIAYNATNRALESEKVLLDEKNKLQKALDEIKTLRGIIPICSHCKQIRDDEGIWNRIEEYVHAHSEASFSHSICPDCMIKYYSEYAPEDADAKEGE